MPYTWRGCFLLFLTLVSSVLANYYIDDTNITLTYSSGPKAAWGPFAIGAETLSLLLPNNTYQTVDASVCFNHTYRYAACFSVDNCWVTVPFTGSGITVYVYQAGPVGINATVTIDGAHSQTNLLAAPPAPAYEIANMTMFNVQNLSSGHHMLTLLVNDFFGSYSGMMFDYAYVNETFVANTTTTTASATSTAASTSGSASSNSGSQIEIGAIVGGIVGAAAMMILSIIVFLWVRRRRRHKLEAISLYSGGASPQFYPNATHVLPLANAGGASNSRVGLDIPSTNNDASMDFAPVHGSTERLSLIPNPLGSQAIGRAQSANRYIPTPFTATPSMSDSSGTQGSKTRLLLSNDAANVPLSQAQTGRDEPEDSQPRADMSPLLSDEQADFVNSLHTNNVPAAAIARVMERMLADRHAGIREWERETRLARSNTMTTAPPSYDVASEGRE